MAIEPFIEKFPNRFFNVGIAEQNMVGMATGLAEAGYIPFVYSIIPFATLRPLEFIRNGPIAHGLPVRIVGVGSGINYSTNGLSHYGIEDIGVLRTQPGISIIFPANAAQMKSALETTWNRPEPIYYRISKGSNNIIPNFDGKFTYGEIDIIEKENDLLILTLGSMIKEVLIARLNLLAKGISASVAIISSLDSKYPTKLTELLSKFSLVCSVEDHYKIGGIGSLISETIADQGLNCKNIRCGFSDLPDGITGSIDYLYEKNNLDAKSIVEKIVSTLEKMIKD